MQTLRPGKLQTLPLQLVLIVPFALQVFGAVALVGYLSFRNGQKAVHNLADQLIERTSSTVNQHLDDYLSIPQKITQMNADAIRLGILDVRDREAVERYFWHQMQAYDLSYIGMGLATGEGAGAGRYDGKTITIDDWSANPPNNWTSYATDDQGNRTEVTGTFDWVNTNEPWYLDPVNAGKPIWSRFVIIDYPDHPYIAASAARPIYDVENQLIGIATADIHLLKLSDFLQRLAVSRSGQVFIVDRNGTLIANSGTEPSFVRADGEIRQLQAIDSPNPAVQAIAKQLQQTFNGFPSITTAQELKFDFQGEAHHVRVTPWRDEYGLDWLVVVSVPDHEFMAQINANTSVTIGLCLAALGVASVMGILTARWIVQPMLRLSQASEAMASGNLEQTVEHSGIRELDTLAHSFNHMAGQLRESFIALEKSNEVLEDRVEERTIELKNTLSELQRTQTQMIQGEKMSSLGQLVAGVAHEINNPVNFIHGNLFYIRQYVQDLLNFVQLYQQQYPQPVADIRAAAEEIDMAFLQADLPKMLSSMQVGTDRIRQIVLSLRTFSRMDEAEIKPVNIHEGIDSTLMILQHRFKARAERPEIQVVKAYGTLPLVACYAGQLNQVFMNILTNAIDALEESNAGRSFSEIQANPNQITIHTALVNAQWVKIAIADNGPGMSKAIQQQIFNPFFTTKPIGKGTGMGMSISYQIITEKHGGTLDCFSTPGEGTEFVIQIPLNKQPASTT